MAKGLILYDYDGTLVDEREAIYTPTNVTKRAISQLQDNGYLCVLATGRALSYISKGAKDLHLDGYVTCNGAFVTMHGKVIHKVIFEDEELSKFVDYMEEKEINFILEGNEFCYVKDMQDAEYLHFVENFKLPKDNFVQYKGKEQVSGKISKITLVFKDRTTLSACADLLKPHYQVCLHRNCNTFDLGKKSVNKGVGTKAIANHYNIPYEKTYAFGDADNDIELLDSVKYGVAMKVHDPVLDDVAYMVTDSVKEEGIYKALKKLEVI